MNTNNGQENFYDEEDSIKFIETLDRYKKKCKMKVNGWCLMGNHVHLLLGEGGRRRICNNQAYRSFTCNDI